MPRFPIAVKPTSRAWSFQISPSFEFQSMVGEMISQCRIAFYKHVARQAALCRTFSISFNQEMMRFQVGILWDAKSNPSSCFHRVAMVEAEVSISMLKAAPMSTELLNRITSNPRQCGGRPCIRGMRIRVKDVLDMLAGSASEEEILADFPYLEPDDIRASLEYAAAQIDHAVVMVS